MLIKIIGIVIGCFGLPIVGGEICAGQNRILRRGLYPTAAEEITNLHNYYRLLIAQGNVTNQPQAKNLRRMSYDKDLEQEARRLQTTCDDKKKGIDKWYWIGENVYLEYSSTPSHEQDWKKAIQSWFEEHINYTFPDSYSKNTKHYTQLIWADTHAVGCEFIVFYEYEKRTSATPYGKLYTCTYGPGGNFFGQPPYIEVADDTSEELGCLDLC